MDHGPSAFSSQASENKRIDGMRMLRWISRKMIQYEQKKKKNFMPKNKKESMEDMVK